MRSLFWTFAAAFFLVLVTSLLLQAFVIVVVVHPFTDRRARIGAEALARDLASEIGARGADYDDEVQEMLRAGERGRELGFVLFRGADGRIIGARPLPPELESRFAHLVETGRDLEPSAGVGENRAFGPPRPPEDFDRGSPPPRGMSMRHALQIVASWPVQGAMGSLGEVFVIRPAPRLPLWPPSIPRPVLLFFPMAVAISGAAAFVLFRLIVRRLRALESLAARVADGDLSARVDDRRHDEIGRLAQKLNEMTARLKDARDDLKEADHSRRRLIADIAHELATPMTTLKGYAETLTDPEIVVSESERESYLRSLLEETDRLDDLVKDLFELTRLEAGAIQLERERLDVGGLLRNLVDRYQLRFRDAGLLLEWRRGDVQAMVDADGRRLEQVAENLLNNGLRYVPAGGSVAVAVTAGAPGGIHRIEVIDDGPGIPHEHLEHIFERFFRADPSRADGGTGLGLAIVREIVDRHGGSIRAENRPGGGARFVVELPAA